MALNGIDAQIMVQRTADYSKDAGGDVRKGELMREYASAMRNAEDRAKTDTVSRKDAPDRARLSGDKGQREGGASGGGGEAGEKKHGEELEPSGPRCDGTGSIIDIEV